MAGLVNVVLALAAPAAQGDVAQPAPQVPASPAVALPVVTIAPVQVASPDAPLSVKMRPSVFPLPQTPPPAYVPRPVYAAPTNPHGPAPMGVPDGWVTAADYPKDALKAEQTGIVVVTLTVAPTGRVTGCAITLSSGFGALDAATCRLLSARGLFSPATDEAGNPTAGIWMQRVRWTLPGVLPYPARPSRLNIRITVEADGSQSHCEITQSEGQLSAQLAKPGPMACLGQKTKPFTDATGKPVRKIVTYSQNVTVEDAPQ